MRGPCWACPIQRCGLLLACLSPVTSSRHRPKGGGLKASGWFWRGAGTAGRRCFCLGLPRLTGRARTRAVAGLPGAGPASSTASEGQVRCWRWRLSSGWPFARSRSMAAASRAAPTAIRVICQPALPASDRGVRGLSTAPLTGAVSRGVLGWPPSMATGAWPRAVACQCWQLAAAGRARSGV
jgi:hypothetical protein